jgi:glycosyltransferase involved in cell wall biosynthesis
LAIFYIVTGPVLSFVVLALTLLGRRRLDRLRDEPRALPTPAPHVRVYVPARDEREMIAATMHAILRQDYPEDRLDLVAIDDRSRDGTGEQMERAAEAGRVRVLQLTTKDVPEGWLGKPHALHHAVANESDTPDWLLFVDSDVSLRPDAVRRCVAAAEGRWDALSLLPATELPTLLEKLTTPIAGAAWLTIFRASDTNADSRPDAAVANGQVLLVRPEALAEAGGHAAARTQTCEDVFLFRRMKANGRRVRLALGEHLATTRMHAGWSSLLNGWSRNFAGTARHRPTRLIIAAAVAWWQIAPVVAVLFLPIAAGMHAVAVAGWCFVALRGAGVRRPVAFGIAVLFPLAMTLLVVLLLGGIRACLGGRIAWRGSLVRA